MYLVLKGVLKELATEVQVVTDRLLGRNLEPLKV